MKTIADIRKMKDAEVRDLVRMVMGGFDQTSRSIARSNVKMALKGRSDIVWTHGKVRSPLMGDRRVKQAITDELRRWSSRMRCEERTTVILEHQGVATATRSTLQELNNTEEMSKKKIKMKRFNECLLTLLL